MNVYIATPFIYVLTPKLFSEVVKPVATILINETGETNTTVVKSQPRIHEQAKLGVSLDAWPQTAAEHNLLEHYAVLQFN